MPERDTAATGEEIIRLTRMLRQFSPKRVARESDELRMQAVQRVRYAPRGRDNFPTQTVVDRREQLQPMLVDFAVTAGGHVLAILRRPPFGQYGPLPSDPARSAEGTDPRSAICGALAPYAALECIAGAYAWP